MTMTLIQNLIEFGLSEKEAKVYVTTLELQAATANEIAKKSEVNRSSTYVVIESLKKQGLVNMTDDKMVKKYIATPPEFLLSLAKKEEEKYEDIKNMIEGIVPSLEALHKDTKHKPKVFVYEGDENVKAVYYKDLASLKPNTDPYRTYEDSSEVDKYLLGFIETDAIERTKKRITLHGINPDTKENREIMVKCKKYTGNLEENILIPIEKFKFPKPPIDFAINRDQIFFYSLKESFVIEIKHQQIADTLKNIFDLAWKEAERLGKKY